MASRIIRPVERMALEFGDNANTDSVWLARRVNVAAFKEVTAYVRVHPGSTIGTNPSVSNFIINADGYTDEDPAANQTLSLPTRVVPGFQFPLVTTDVKAMTAGQMTAIGAGSNFGSMLSLQWEVKTASSTMIILIVSVDLICKEF